MGEVYLAEDLTLNRKVALKFLLSGAPGGPDEVEGRRRLLREARAAAQLDHPFVCKVYEVGEEAGRAFLAMEFVEGVTLKERLAGGRRLDPDEAARIGGEIAEALHLAHTRGIVHRDLKPANVMLASDGHVKVMDFGVAKRLAAPLAAADSTIAAMTVSLPGELTGTPAYMSPEQLRGESIDARSDEFAFGMLLYELLTGTNPFKRSSTLDTAHAILNDTPPSLEQAVPDIPPLLAHVVSRCLDKDRERRYQSLGDVRLELDAVRKPATVAAPSARPRRRRWIQVAAAIAALLACVYVINWIRPLPFLAPEPALAFQARDWIVVADFNNLTNDPVFDKSLRLALEVAIAQSQYVNVYPPDRVGMTLQRMQKKPGRLDAELASEVAVRDGIRGVLACDIAQLGNVYAITARLIDPQTRTAVLTDSVQARSKDGVLDALGELATRVRSSLGESLAGLSAQAQPLPKVTTASLEALKLYSDGMFLEGRDSRTANELLRQAIALDPDFALAYAELGRRYYLSSGRAAREEGERLMATALQLTDRLSLRERLWIQAIAEDSRGNRARAADAYKTYLAQYPDDSRAWFRLAWTQMAALDQPAEAARGFKEALRLRPEDSSALVNLAGVYSIMEDYEAAVPTYQKAFALDQRLFFGPFINHEYGFTLVRIGRFSEAEDVFERMKKDGSGADRAKGYRSRALLDMYRGRYASATDQLREAIVIDQGFREEVSEFRDRMFHITALQARNQTAQVDAAWVEAHRLIARLSLSPGWLYRPVRTLARRGRIREAAQLVARMEKTMGSATADSSVARNTAEDRANLEYAQAEIAMASGRPTRAIELLGPVREVLRLEATESLANAYALSGRLPEAIASYEEFLRKPLLAGELQEIWFESHVALGRLYEQEKRPNDARRVYAKLLELWKGGDADLVLLKVARERLAKLGGNGER